jgi:hypothetical protein
MARRLKSISSLDARHSSPGNFLADQVRDEERTHHPAFSIQRL